MREPTLDEWIGELLSRNEYWYWGGTFDPDAFAMAEKHKRFDEIVEALGGPESDAFDAFSDLVTEVCQDVCEAVRESAAKDVTEWIEKEADPWNRLLAG